MNDGGLSVASFRLSAENNFVMAFTKSSFRKRDCGERLTDKQFYEQNAQDFWGSVGLRAGRIVKYTALIRFVINLLLAKLNPIKALKNYKTVLQLSLGCGAFNIIYHLVRRVYALRRKAISDAAKKSVFMS